MEPSDQRTIRALLSRTSLPVSSCEYRHRIVFSTWEGGNRGGGREERVGEGVGEEGVGEEGGTGWKTGG